MLEGPPSCGLAVSCCLWKREGSGWELGEKSEYTAFSGPALTFLSSTTASRLTWAFLAFYAVLFSPQLNLWLTKLLEGCLANGRNWGSSQGGDRVPLLVPKSGTQESVHRGGWQGAGRSFDLFCFINTCFMVVWESLVLDRESHYVAIAGLELTVILLPLLPEFWEYRQRQFCLTPHIPICSQSVLVFLF